MFLNTPALFVLAGGAAVKAGVQEGDRIIKVFLITTRFVILKHLFN